MSFERELAETLDALRGPERAESLDLVAQLEDLYATTLRPDVRAFVELLQDHELGSASNLFQATEAEELAAGNAFWLALRSSIALIAPFTASFPVGKDGGGQWYYVSLDPRRDEMGIYGPGVGELRLLADSFASFAGLVRVEALVDQHVEDEELDRDAVYEGDTALDLSSPALERVAELLGALEGHVHLPGYEGTDVCSDFDEIMILLHGGETWQASPRTELFNDHERSYPLQRMLDHGGIWSVPVCDQFERVPDALVHLWGAYFGPDDRALADARRRGAAHPARMVRDATALIDGVLEGAAEWSGLSHLRALRQLVLAGEPKIVAPAGHEALIAPEAGDDESTLRLKSMLRDDPSNADAWDNLTFSYYQREAWEPMDRCAEISIALRPRHYYAWMQRAVVALANDRHDDALEALDVSLCFDSNPNLYLNKALCFDALGRRDEVVATLRELPAHSRRELIEAVEDLAPYVAELDG